MEKWVVPALAIGTIGAGIGGVYLYDQWLHNRFYGLWTGPHGLIRFNFLLDRTVVATFLEFIEMSATWTVLDGQHIRFEMFYDEPKYIDCLYVMEPLSSDNQKYLLLTIGANNLDIPEGTKIDLIWAGMG